VSGPAGREVVHYSAPPAAAVRAEMRTFLDWFNRTQETRELDGILRVEGGMTPRKYGALNNTTYITSNRDLVDLVDKHLIVREGAGRSTYNNLTIPGWGWSLR